MLNTQYLSIVQNQLTQLAAQNNFATAFDNQFDPGQLQRLQQECLSGDFSVIPDTDKPVLCMTSDR
jgi:hypothetical protein